MPVIDYLRLFEGWIKSPRTMFIFGAASGLPLFLPTCWLEAIHVAEGIERYRLWFWLIFLISVMGLIYEAGIRIRQHCRIKYRLRHLAADEQEFLSHYVHENSSSRIVLGSQASPGASLTTDGILFLTPTIGKAALEQTMVYYTIRPWVLRYVRKHPKHLGNWANPPQNSN